MEIYSKIITGFSLSDMKDKVGFSQRSRVDIIACILGNSNSSSRKTRLIYRCNLSLSQFNFYAECLIQGNLLRKYEKNGKGFYETTEKGKSFLNDYANIREVLESMRLKVFQTI
jgi:predicted transcriptional regulator